MNRQEDHPKIRQIRPDETMPLRLEVLRPGKPEEAARFEGDDDPATRHLGIFVDQELVGIASLFAVQVPRMPGISAFQLRGMAIAPAHQRTGLGAKLLRACVDYVRTTEARIVWCNARRSATGFYRKHGFEVITEEFEIPGVGPHFQMLRRL